MKIHPSYAITCMSLLLFAVFRRGKFTHVFMLVGVFVCRECIFKQSRLNQLCMLPKHTSKGKLARKYSAPSSHERNSSLQEMHAIYHSNCEVFAFTKLSRNFMLLGLTHKFLL